MINHARTLLLNISAERTQLQDAGYEYVPEAFKPIALDSTLSTLRRTIFGATPDNYFLNVRARELLGYIHETELKQYVYALDPRVTYWPPGPTSFFENAKARVSITQTAGDPLRLNFGGTFKANNATGTSVQTYDVVLNNVAGTLSVDTQQTTKIAAPVTTEIASTAAVQPITLAETNLRFSVNFAATAPDSEPTTAALITETADLIITEQYSVENTPIGLELEPQEFLTMQMRAAPERPRMAATLPAGPGIARWQITTIVNPTPLIANISRLELLGEPLFLELFGISGAEPYKTFKNLWEDHPLPAYRLSGLVLALIYRTNERMRANNG